jgi:hypothetical protein
MSDADEPEPLICDAPGYENEPTEGGYCVECADISSDILSSDDGDDSNDTLEEGHRASDVSPCHDEPESEATESADSGSGSPVEDGADDANPGFATDEPAAHDHPDHEQSNAVVGILQRAPDERRQRRGPR